MGCSGSKSQTQVEKVAPQVDDGQGQLLAVVDKYALSEKSFDEYMSNDKDIVLYRKLHVAEVLRVRLGLKRQLETNIKSMEEEVIELEKQTGDAECGDGVVKHFLMKQENYDELTAYKKADLLAAINRKEIVKKEMEGSQLHLMELDHECQMLEEDVDDLKELCQMQDRFLDTWFNGVYGSQCENELEEELDLLLLKWSAYEECNFKWRQTQVMVEYACKQIGRAVETWEQIMHLPIRAMTARFKLAEETRNNLIAAGQNVQGAHRYLHHIRFPYCSAEEVLMLNKATTYVFTDMQAKSRQVYALDCYTAAHKRTGALLQWINQTINVSIRKPLMSTKDKVMRVSKELRKERANLVMTLFKQQLDMVIEVPPQYLDFDAEFSLEKELMLEEEGSKGNNVTMRSYAELQYSLVPNAPSPLAPEDLAPPPTDTELFGGVVEEALRNRKKKVQVNGKEKPVQRRHKCPQEQTTTDPPTVNNNNNDQPAVDLNGPSQVLDIEDDDVKVTDTKAQVAHKNKTNKLKKY